MTQQYLAEHRAELFAQTWERVQRSSELWELYEKEQRKRQRELERKSRYLRKEGGPERQKELLSETYVQNGEQK